ncbi:NXPE family member 3-like isoform X1 [Ruditapes philippinarum]|uniref:NXPE family member 3-like isoform X1 n=1 Tax=Ruditapes philippinarum TaxID=129788 RepID=UPI00295BF25D|nr:NXPE family member 3-like isoform X1 [Ruditapes philippinarum]
MAPYPSPVVRADRQTNRNQLKSLDVYKDPMEIYKSGVRCNDSLLAAEATRSAIYIQGRSSVVLGEYFCFSVVLYNGYGNPKVIGGDHLRARLFNERLKAYTPGTILDHGNGTYTATVQALWTGQAQLQVEVLYTKEIMTTAVRLRSTWDFDGIKAIYMNKNLSDSTACGPDYKTVLRHSKISKVCDFSYWNKTQPWFCGKPKGKLSCKHWITITRDWANFTKGISLCEEELCKSDRTTTIPSHITVQTLPRTDNKNKTTFQEANIPCSVYNNTKLWFKEEPTGYFYNDRWILLHCKGIEHFDGQCLRNKTIVFWGDSTLFQWCIYLMEKLCPGGKYAFSGWSKIKKCTICKYSINICFLGHNIPVFQFWKKELHSFFLNNSLEDFINARSGKGTDLLLVLNLYLHIQQYHLDYYAAHILELRRIIELIFDRKPNIQVFIKLPHTYRRMAVREWQLRINDYIGFIYTNILRKTFKGLYKKVTVLDQMDATIARRSIKLHPPKTVVGEMVNQFLSYACKPNK